jgi:hypothetical protein
MEVALGSGTARQNDSLVEHAQVVLLLLLPRGASLRAARESQQEQEQEQDDEIYSRRGGRGRCGRFLSVDSQNAMWGDVFVFLPLWQIQIDDEPPQRLVLAACGVDLE